MKILSPFVVLVTLSTPLVPSQTHADELLSEDELLTEELAYEDEDQQPPRYRCGCHDKRPEQNNGNESGNGTEEFDDTAQNDSSAVLNSEYQNNALAWKGWKKDAPFSIFNQSKKYHKKPPTGRGQGGRSARRRAQCDRFCK